MEPEPEHWTNHERGPFWIPEHRHLDQPCGWRWIRFPYRGSCRRDATVLDIIELGSRVSYHLKTGRDYNLAAGEPWYRPTTRARHTPTVYLPGHEYPTTHSEACAAVALIRSQTLRV